MDPEIGCLKRCVNTLLSKFDYLRKDLHTASLKELKAVVQKLPDIIPSFVDILFTHLNREDSDRRLGVLLLTNYFFQRSHQFRQEIVNCLEDFLIYTLETDSLHYPLPKPEAAAQQLKHESLVIVRAWVEKFAAGYPKLENGRRFLQTSKFCDFDRSDAEIQIERERINREHFNRELQQRKVREKIDALFGDSRADIAKTLTEARNVLELICPKFSLTDDDPFAPPKNQAQNQKLHGYNPAAGGIHPISINLDEIGCVEESDDNADILATMADCQKMMSSHLARVNKWLKALTEIGDSSALTRQLIDEKNALANELGKLADIKVRKCAPKEFFPPRSQKATADKGLEDSSSSDDNDDDFNEYNKDLELDFSLEQSTSSALTKPKTGEDVELASALKQIKQMEQRSEAEKANPLSKNPTSSSSSLPIKANENGTVKEKSPPRLTLGLDLLYWEESRVDPGSIVRNDIATESFWRQTDTEAVAESQSNQMAESTYRFRAFPFVGEMPAIERRCKAPLPLSGRLCPRMDRNCCPIHGRIIDRDDQGFPIEEQPTSSTSTTSSKMDPPCSSKKSTANDDLEFLRDVEAVTGVSGLAPPPNNRVAENSRASAAKPCSGTARRREPSAAAKTRERLSAKLLNPRTLKRVSKTLSDIQRAKAERKFAHQFNYQN